MPSDNKDRLIAAIGMMGADSAGGDGEAVNAFRQATRMLKARGLTWADVATRAFPAETGRASSDPRPSPAPAPQGFADIFDGMFSDFARGFQRNARPTGPTRPRHKRRITGADVPAEVVGKVSIVDADRAWREGPMLVLDIEGDDAVHGPLICFAASVQADLRAAHEVGRRVMVRVRPPRSEGHMPVVSSATRI